MRTLSPWSCSRYPGDSVKVYLPSSTESRLDHEEYRTEVGSSPTELDHVPQTSSMQMPLVTYNGP